jgi:hypothetical protein
MSVPQTASEQWAYLVPHDRRGAVKFWKAHGLGNDYLVLEAALTLDAQLVK